MDHDITILNKNESFVRLKADKYLLQEVQDYFTFFVPGYKFMPAYKNKMWDGKLRLLNLNNNELYRGLLPYLESFCEDHDYSFSYASSEINATEQISDYQIKKFVEDLNIHSGNKKIDVRDYQLEAVMHSLRFKRATLLSPTSSGKSLIIYLLVRYLTTYKFPEGKGLLLVPTTQLVEQMYSDFADYSSKIDWMVDDNAHRIYSGKEKLSEKGLYISTWQSVHNLHESYFEKFDYVINDEVHLAKGKSITKVISNCINSKYRIGLTGTLDGTKCHSRVIEGLFGPVKKVITTKELMDRNQVSQFKIKCLVLKYDEETCNLCKKLKYQDEIKFLISNPQRNKFIKNLALSMKNNTLILYNYVDSHGKILYEMISRSKYLGDRKVFFVHGAVAAEERENIRKIVEDEHNAIIVASYGVFSTGTNLKNLHNIIFASPSKSRIRNLQSIGRGLRLSDKKSQAVLYDIADDLRYKGRKNFTLEHFVERIKIYNEEKFDFNMKQIDLKETK